MLFIQCVCYIMEPAFEKVGYLPGEIAAVSLARSPYGGTRVNRGTKSGTHNKLEYSIYALNLVRLTLDSCLYTAGISPQGD